jgi:hypothetical protein
MTGFHKRYAKTLNESAFANPGHTGNAKPNRFSGMRQQLINDLARPLLMVGARTFDQGDGFRQQPAVLFPHTSYICFKIFWIHTPNLRPALFII